MKLSYNQATTKENSNLERDLKLCEENGYDYIEINVQEKLPEYLNNYELKDLANYFKTHHIKPLALNGLEFFNNQPDDEFDKLRDQFKSLLETASKLGVQYIIVVPLITDEKIHLSEIKKSAVNVLREFSELAEPFGIRIAVEFVGQPKCTINTFGQAYDIIEEVDRTNIGLVLDFFHFHAMGSREKDLMNADIDKIFIVHIDDAEAFPIGAVTDQDRLWPGEGVIDLDWLIKEINQKGYSGAVTVELFRPEYYRMNPEEAIKKAKNSTLSVLRNSGVVI